MKDIISNLLFVLNTMFIIIGISSFFILLIPLFNMTVYYFLIFYGFIFIVFEIIILVNFFLTRNKKERIFLLIYFIINLPYIIYYSWFHLTKQIIQFT